MAAAEHQRHGRRIIARVHGEVRWHQAQQVDATADIAGRIFHADNIRDGGQAHDGFVAHVGNRAARHVVQDDGNVDGFGDGLEVLVHAFLGRTVVVRHHLQDSIGARFFRIARQFDGLGRGVASGAGDDRNASLGMFDGQLDQFAVFFHADCCRFARRANDDDAVRTLGDMPVDQLAQTWKVQTAVCVHRGDDCYNAALDHSKFIAPINKTTIVADSPRLWCILT